MRTSDRMKQLFWLATTLALAACNGGIGGTGGNDGGGGNRQSVSVGTVDATGSVMVNGVTYDTSSAAITVDETAASEMDLQQGMVVAVRGTIDAGGTTGTAATVAAEDVVKGPAVFVDANNLTVMGQNVKVGVDTILEPSTQPLSYFGGKNVEVSGYVVAPGIIHATRIEEKIALTTYKVTGFIGDVDATTIDIGTQIIPTTGADLSGMEGQPLTIGQLVEVKADNVALTTPTISLFGHLDEDDGTEVELEGFVTSVAGMPDSFMLGSQPVSITGSTDFDGGTIDDLILGAHVEVEGMMSGGILIADEIEFEESIELEANVASVAGGVITLSLLDIDVETDLNTEINVKDVMDADSIDLADLQTGEHVRIRGRLAGDGVTIVATRVEEQNADTRIILQGPVTAIDAMAFTLSILSHPIATDGTEQYRGSEDQVLSRTQFFDALVVGRLVKADGDENGMNIDWAELELED